MRLDISASSPQADQAQIAALIAQIVDDNSHPDTLRAHAALQFGICVHFGFGVDKDIDIGLKWVGAAAEGGNRKARAIVRRLHRSYGHDYPKQECETGWLIRETAFGSYWALEELKAKEAKEIWEETLKQGVFAHPTAGTAPR